MLQTDHQGKQYSKPVLATQPGRPRSYEQVYRLLGPVYGQEETAGGKHRDLGDSGEVTLEEFARQYLDARDRLAYRKLRGKSLSPREQSMLAALNRMLEQLLPPPAALPSNVKEMVDEILRLKRR
jgi:hypothetical protein